MAPEKNTLALLVSCQNGPHPSGTFALQQHAKPYVVGTTMPTPPMQASCQLLDALSTELRLMIWRKVLPYRPSSPTCLQDGRIAVLADERWLPGNVALLRVSRQVYSEAMPILYREETFTVVIQPRRAFMEFLPADRKQQPKFGLVTSNDSINVYRHPGFSQVLNWTLAVTYHSVHDRGKQKLKVRGFQAFLKWLPQTPRSLHLVIRDRQNKGFIRQQLMWTLIVCACKAMAGKLENLNQRPVKGCTTAPVCQSMLKECLIGQPELALADIDKHLEAASKLLYMPQSKGQGCPDIRFVTKYVGLRNDRPRM